MAADISLGAVNGARAVVYVQHQLAAMPQLRPLVLVVKAFLRQHNLNEARGVQFSHRRHRASACRPNGRRSQCCAQVESVRNSCAA